MTHPLNEETLRIVSSDGHAIALRSWPASDPSKHVVIGLHGMTSHAGWFEPLAVELVGRGISVCAPDRRGSGRDRAAARATDPEAWVDDVVAVLQFLRRTTERLTVLCWCWSARLGPLAVRATPVDDIIFATPGLFMSDFVVQRTKPILAGVGDDLALPFDPLDDFSDIAEVRRFIEDDALRWRSFPRAFVEPSERLRAASLEAIGAITVPILCIIASDDKIIDNASTRAFFSTRAIREVRGGHALVLEQPAELASLVAVGANGDGSFTA